MANEMVNSNSFKLKRDSCKVYVTPMYIKEAQHSSVWLHQLALHGFEQISIIMSLAPVTQNELRYSLKLLVKRLLF